VGAGLESYDKVPRGGYWAASEEIEAAAHSCPDNMKNDEAEDSAVYSAVFTRCDTAEKKEAGHFGEENGEDIARDVYWYAL
jgi:hypothetical protein